MPIVPINLGTAPLGTDGDTAREAFTKVNESFSDLDSRLDGAGGLSERVEQNEQDIEALGERVGDNENAIGTLSGRSISAGDGLTGGGDLSEDRTVTLGAPGTITGISENQVTSDSHTHEISDTLPPSKAYRQGNLLGVVSLAGGSPTGAVIERGSNANGEYVRFADGTQICWHEINLGPLDAGSGSFADPYRHSSGAPWTYPAQFVGVPSVSFSAYISGGGSVLDRWIVIGYANPSSTAVSALRAQRLNTGSGLDDIIVAAVSIGRWV